MASSKHVRGRDSSGKPTAARACAGREDLERIARKPPKERYTYNTDGSLTGDQNKGISAITYNVLGKPQVVTYSGTPAKTVTYTYDAAGAKIRTVTVADGVTTTTDYAGGFVYTNNALSFFSSPEGRVVKNGANFEYQYAIADHQGNTRVLFSSAAPVNTPINATFEGGANDGAGTFTSVNPSKVVPGGSAANSGTKVIRLDPAYKVGPTRSLHVYPGDKVDMEVWEYHEAASGYAPRPLPWARWSPRWRPTLAG